jgi:hypothetical protein
MPNWKKLILSGSNASLNSLIVTSGVTGSLYGTSSYTINAVTASYAYTASSADSFIVRNSLTASNLHYPTTDGTYASQVLQTDAVGTLSFGDVQTTYDTVYNGESTTLIKGTPVYISGSQGANPKVYRADASVASKMPVTYIISEDIITATTGRGITLGHIDGINLTGYNVGASVYVANGGGWTAQRPTGSNEIIQFLGLITKNGTGGKGLILNPGPATLPNLPVGYIWIGDTTNQPVAVVTSSIHNVVSASYAVTASSVNVSVNVASAHIGGALYNTTIQPGVSTNSTIFTISTVGTYTSGFIDYHVTDGGANARSGQIQIAYVGGQVVHNETATQDIGNTSGFQWDVVMSGSDINLDSIVTSGVWDIKIIARII